MRCRVFVEPQQGASYDQLLAAARATEAAGFDAFFRSDHYLSFGGSGLPGPTDAWTSLAALARETERVRLGTLVSPATFRLPGPLALMVAQVDDMSGGRVELGLGAGWYDAEHTAYGIPFPPVAERFDRLEEQLQIITGLWGTPVGGTFEFAGPHYRLGPGPALPKPRQAPHPPVIVGGGGRSRTPALAARFADEFNLGFHGVADTTAQFERVRRACAAVGREPSTLGLSVAATVCCGTDEAEQRRRAAAIGRQLDELRTNAVAGSPAEVVARCAEFAAAGADTIYLQVLDLSDLEHISLLGAEVVPALRSLP